VGESGGSMIDGILIIDKDEFVVQIIVPD